MTALDVLRLLGVNVFVPVGDGGGDLFRTGDAYGKGYSNANGSYGYNNGNGYGCGYNAINGNGTGNGNGNGYGYGRGSCTVRLIRNRR